MGDEKFPPANHTAQHSTLKRRSRTLAHAKLLLQHVPIGVEAFEGEISERQLERIRLLQQAAETGAGRASHG